MNLIQHLLSSLFILTALISPLCGKEDFTVEDQPNASLELFNLPNFGTLKQKENGFIYLDVDNGFINNIVSNLEIEGRLQPRPTASQSIGAHISVFHESEAVLPKELGSPFSFDTKEIRSFTLHTRDGLKKLWVVAVNAPELELLRDSYGLSTKLKGFDYHITLGKQMPTAPAGWETVETLSSFNFSDEPTLDLKTSGDFVTIEDSEILKELASIEQIGQLKLKSNGFVYLDVNNQLIDTIWQKLPIEGEFKALATDAKKMGAHISVIHEDEMIGKGIWNLLDAGQWFTFEVKEIRYVDRNTPKGQNRLWLLAVDSPALQRLRIHLGLKPKLKNHDFHITLGYEEIQVQNLEEAA